MKTATAQETKKYFSTFWEKPIQTELFEDSVYYDEMVRMEKDRQEKHQFMLQFADLGEMEWHRETSLFVELGLEIINSITLSDGNKLYAIGRDGKITGYMTDYGIIGTRGEINNA